MALKDWIFDSGEVATLTVATVATEEPEEVRALGYGCGRCEANNYLKVDGGWRCEGCGKIFEIIGGTRGPVLGGGGAHILGAAQGKTGGIPSI
ncbi:hypothetical protein ACHHRT_04085 [Desulfurivibrio sp. D14AmB]|uniref:hypothetical protein n=1 Tax=Desulfurivibrio sp. D14AmB TaxID=3374370 RepID=UPI00376F1CEC